MMNLNIFIKNEFIKNKFNESSYEIISDLEAAESLAYKVSQGEFTNIIFESFYLKDRFFSLVKSSRPDISIINCNANPYLVEKQIWESGNYIIYNNVNKCKDDIINIINDKKGMWVC